MARKKITVTPTVAEEAPMSKTQDPVVETIVEKMYGSDEVTEMTDAEAIETLVRTDEEHLTDDTPKQVLVAAGEQVLAVGQAKRPTQGQVGMFHVLSEIDDGVFVAWDRCHNGKERHNIADCKCKGGPVEPPYVTKWREEWIAKREKQAEKTGRRWRLGPPDERGVRKHVEVGPDTPPLSEQPSELAATVSDGIEKATAAVAEASEEETK